VTPFQTQVDPTADAFLANRRDMLGLVEQLRRCEARAEALSEKRRETFAQRGQLTPRERVHRLLDPGLPVLELYNLANFLVEDPNRETSVPGASMVCGIGFVSGVRCLVVADDSGINAGAVTPMSVPKILGAMDIAIAHKLPFVHLVESAGANLLQYAVETWAHGGGLYYRRALMSAAGIPTISVLHGLSTAGGAYQPGLSDYVVGVKGNGMAALGGSALVRAATGEISDDRELGSSEMHATVSGLVEYLADDDAHGLRLAREIVASLDWNRHCPPLPQREVTPPRYATDEVTGIVPVDYRKPYDVRELIARLADGSEFTDFKSRHGVATVCVQARVFGHAVGIVGNNGPLDPAGATKAAQFLQLCDQAQMPLVFLNNTTGFMVGREYERAGMIKHGSKMIQAVSNVRVPRIAFYVGPTSCSPGPTPAPA
jgi:geranyl-CoA carboxylase beta subunit